MPDRMPCLVEECDRDARTRGMCWRHYNKYRRHATVADGRFKQCSYGGCTGVAVARKLCQRHYTRFLRYGDPGPRPIPPCDIEGCESAAASKGKCRVHYGLSHFYGITSERYTEMLSAQGGVCAICCEPERRRTKAGLPMRLSVDHDHGCCPRSGRGTERTCGKCVRGLICADCNRGIGLFGDDPERLEAAARYLRSF